jgi:hypothetical protein
MITGYDINNGGGFERRQSDASVIKRRNVDQIAQMWTNPSLQEDFTFPIFSSDFNTSRLAARVAFAFEISVWASLPSRRRKASTQVPPLWDKGSRYVMIAAQFSNEAQVNVTCAYGLAALSLQPSNLDSVPRAMAVSGYILNFLAGSWILDQVVGCG